MHRLTLPLHLLKPSWGEHRHGPPLAQTTTPSRDSPALLLFLEGELNVQSLCPAAPAYDRVGVRDTVSAHESLVGWLQTLPVGMRPSSHLTHGGEGAVSRKSFSMGGLFLRSKSLLHITDLQSSWWQFKRLPSSVFHLGHLPEDDAP